MYSSGFVPLPEEAIGPGAEWDSLGHMDAMGVKAQLAARYKLVALDGNVAKLELAMRGRAEPQKAQLPNAPVEVDLTPVAEGQVIKVFWRGKPIFVNHRTPKEIKEAEDVNLSSLPDPQPDSARVKKGHANFQVLIGICTHLGCIPLAHAGPYNGYFCPCHGSVYDTSGRIRSGPAPLNLTLPPYEFLSDTRIRIGLRQATILKALPRRLLR